MTSRRRLVAAGTATAWWLLTGLPMLAASPSPDPAGGDPRSVGQGPGLVGDPGFALLVVIGIGLLSVVATVAYVRLTARRGT